METRALGHNGRYLTAKGKRGDKKIRTKKGPFLFTAWRMDSNNN